ncbi:hypothetical protein QUF80_00885 [Desulfococcaceae bacterium HSG8]|nr:hypothetical protein [Desulfococcaceae bacterium HSG8]
MEKLLKPKENHRWNLEGIEFAIKERVGDPSRFIGRVGELEFLYRWADNIRKELSRSIAFLGRRKIGKTLVLERLYNILYSERKGVIPFYYEFREGRRSGQEFYIDFAIRFYMQVVGYYTRDITWNRRAVKSDTRIPDIGTLLEEIAPLSLPNKDIITDHLRNSMSISQLVMPQYEYVLAAVGVPEGFATMVGVEDQIVQMLDEFQYLNMHIDAGVEDKPCKAYMSPAESRVAPLLITGSLMGVVSHDLMRWLPQRFDEFIVPKMNTEESVEMTLNYGRLFGQRVSRETASYIVHITNNVPGRITDLLLPKFGKPMISSPDDADEALAWEVEKGRIRSDWEEYLSHAMNSVNDVNLRRITYFLCRHEGEWYYPGRLRQAMSLDLDEGELRRELRLLHRYDLIEERGGRYGGVFDRTLKKVLMTVHADLYGLPVDEFDSYFRNDNMLDDLKDRAEHLELELEQAEELREKLGVLQGRHNNLKGRYYEQEVLLRLVRHIMAGKGGIVKGISVTEFAPVIGYHLTSGEEIDIVLEGKQSVIMAECKNYLPRYLHKITRKTVDEFTEKAARLHNDRFSGKELRLAFFSRHGFESRLETYLEKKGIVTEFPE